MIDSFSQQFSHDISAKKKGKNKNKNNFLMIYGDERKFELMVSKVDRGH